MTPQKALNHYFGYPAFRPGQEAVIDALLAGHSSLAVFPTGGGKSLCFQIPALLLEGLTLVISPLIALMKDQVDTLQARGIAAARLDSTLTAEEVRTIYDQLKTGELKMLYVAPERLANERFVQRLAAARISLLAIDEAHCISEWGHNFRPDYLKLTIFAKEIKAERVLGLTATATPKVSEDICAAFSIIPEHHIQTGFRRPNLTFQVAAVAAAEKHAWLKEALTGEEEEPTIIYVTLQHTAESVATFLTNQGIPAKAYHAGLRDDYRAEVQEAFMKGSINIVVATIAFGMGIDKADIRRIYHYNAPKSIENYVQETGRAGRDGTDSKCTLLACEDDRIILENFIYGDTPSTQSLDHLMDHLLRQGEAFDISRYDLSWQVDIRPLVINTVLTYLELEGVIQSTGPFYTAYKVQYHHSVDHIIAGYNEERQAFLRKLFATGKKGWKWHNIILEETAEEIGEPKERISKALEHLRDAGDLMMKPAGLRHGYRRLYAPEDCAPLYKRIHALFHKREHQDLQRLQLVIDFAKEQNCLTGFLLNYFGEDLDEPCGTCSSCQGNPVKELPNTLTAEIPQDAISAMQEAIKEQHPALRAPRQMARFLCGIASPAATRGKLKKHDAFAILEETPFQSVLEMAEEAIL